MTSLSSMRNLSALALLLLATRAQAQGIEPDDAFVRKAISVDRMEEDLRILTGVDPWMTADGEVFIESRAVAHPDIQLAEAYLVEALEELPGAEVWTEPVELTTDHPSANVIADFPGDHPERDWVLVVAHYDCESGFTPGWSPTEDPSPGAEDNGSGTVAVLAAARVLASWHGGFGRPVRIALFTGEERGLWGSYEHVERLEERGEDVHLTLNLDMVGFNPDGADSLDAYYQDVWTDELLDLQFSAAHIGSPLAVNGVDEADVQGGACFSDHCSFWMENHPALMLASSTFSTEYHTTDDVIEHIDLDFAGEVAALTAAAAASAAEPRYPREVAGVCGPALGGTLGGSSVGLGAILVLLLGRRREQGRSDS